MKEGYELGIFYVKREGQNAFTLARQGSKVVLRIFEEGRLAKEREYSTLPWRRERLFSQFLDVLTGAGFGTVGLEQEIIGAESDYLDWLARPREEAAEEENEVIETSFVAGKERLYEEVFDGESGKFVYLNDGGMHTADIVREGGRVYRPIVDDAILQKAVLLPTGLEDYESVEKLIGDIQTHISLYLDVSGDFLVFASYYILLSWIYDRMDTLPYLRAMGDTGTGKSRFLRVIGGLCYKPIFVAGAITPAPIYRMIKRWGGTIVLDEADFKDSSEKSEVVTILNCGFSRGTPVIRCEKDNPDNVQILPTFSPKVIATRYPFGDKALESRCLTENMKQTVRRDLPRILPALFYEMELKLRNQLLKFRFDYYGKVDTSKIHEISLGNIEPRLEQATLSFAVLFYNIEDLFVRFKAFLANYQKQLIEDRANSFDGLLVNTLFQLKRENYEHISAQTIVETLKEQGINTTSQTVGKHLKALGIRTHQKRIENRVRNVIEPLSEAQTVLLRQRYDPEFVVSVVSVVKYLGTTDTKNEYETGTHKSNSSETPPEPTTNSTLTTLTTENAPQDHPSVGDTNPTLTTATTAASWGPCPSCKAPLKYSQVDGCVLCGYREGQQSPGEEAS